MRHLDIDYVHLSTRNRIVSGEEVAFSAKGVTNQHFRRLSMEATNVTANETADVTGSLLIGCSPLCTEICPYAADGDCDDGGDGSEYSACSIGSDCTDCTSRCAARTPPALPPPMPPRPPCADMDDPF
eukprot:3143203-Prymnesium_polylepis.1